jgi:hypothetical protein
MLDGGQIGKIYPLRFASLRLNLFVIWFAPGSAPTQRPTNTWLAMSGDAPLLPLSVLPPPRHHHRQHPTKHHIDLLRAEPLPRSDPVQFTMHLMQDGV